MTWAPTSSARIPVWINGPAITSEAEAAGLPWPYKAFIHSSCQTKRTLFGLDAPCRSGLPSARLSGGQEHCWPVHGSSSVSGPSVGTLLGIMNQLRDRSPAAVVRLDLCVDQRGHP